MAHLHKDASSCDATGEQNRRDKSSFELRLSSTTASLSWSLSSLSLMQQENQFCIGGTNAHCTHSDAVCARVKALKSEGPWSSFDQSDQ